jgi:hypothetical protein
VSVNYHSYAIILLVNYIFNGSHQEHVYIQCVLIITQLVGNDLNLFVSVYVLFFLSQHHGLKNCVFFV